MRKILFIISFILLGIVSTISFGAKRDPIIIIIEPSTTGDNKLDKALNEYKKNLEEKTKIKLGEHKKAYFENEGQQYLLKLLYSLGYYGGNVEIIEKNNSLNSITFNIVRNNQYLINNIETKILETSANSSTNLNLPKSKWYSFSKGEAALAKKILAEEKRVENYIKNHNCILSLEVTHQAIVNHLTHTMDVIYNIKAGPEAYINTVSFKGLKTIKEEYVRKLVPIKDGVCFRIGEIEQAKTELPKSGLFLTAEPIIPTQPNKNGGVNIIFEVKERKQRSIKAGLIYSTDLGPGLTGGWEHRNVFSQGEKINVKLYLTRNEQTLDSQFEKNAFIVDNQKLKLSSAIEKKDSKAYFTKGASMAAFLERSLTTHLTGSIGTKFSFNRVSEDGPIENYKLLSFPLQLTHDSRNNLLHPTKGGILKFEITPFVNLKENKGDPLNFKKNKENFFKTQILGTHYFNLNKEKEIILALRGATGGIKGNSKIPAIERFYVGGGGSVRGYGYQLVGPLNKRKEPTGGRSFIETSTELRLKYSKKIGYVLFLDGGNVYDTLKPNFKSKLFWGYGVGLRYYTGFGPLRMDIAFPKIRRRKIDKLFQLYISIGQAF